MKNQIYTLTLFVLSLIGCKHDNEEVIPQDCTIAATVKDMGGLDGCGYVFVLADGKVLEPYWQWGFCGTPPLPIGATEDPLYDFEYVDGQSVLIGYHPVKDGVSVCMAGELVKITCLSLAVAFEK